MIGQNTKQNDFQVQYDVTPSFGVRAGFIWENLNIQPGQTLTRRRWATSTIPTCRTAATARAFR